MSKAQEEIRHNLYTFYDQVALCKGIYAESRNDWAVIKNDTGIWPRIIYRVDADLFQKEQSHELIEKVRSGHYPEVLIATDENIRQMDPFLRTRGFYPFMAWKGMAKEYTGEMQTPELPENVQVVTLDQLQDQKQWANIISNELIAPTLFDQALIESLRARPGVELYLLKYDGEGVSTLMTYDSGQSTGLYMIATKQSAQRKGFGHLLVQQIVAKMSSQSKKPIILHATQKGEGLYAKSGFQPYNQFFLYRYLNPQP